jgi:bacterioferritin-associated ferredoxin
VTDREIRQAVELGCDSFGEVSCGLGVATSCGKCKQEACRVIDAHIVELRTARQAVPKF